MSTLPESGTVMQATDDEESLTDLRFPEEIEARLESLFPDHEPTTFRELIETWTEKLELDGATPPLDNFYTDDDTQGAEFEAHVVDSSDSTDAEVEFDENASDFCCIVDPMVLSFLLDDPIEISSNCPQSETDISLELTSGGVESTSSEAVISFGVASDSSDIDSSSDSDIPRSEFSPYVRLFASREAYEEWDSEDEESSTVALSVEDAHHLARKAYWSLERKTITSSSIECDCLLTEPSA